MLNLFQATHVKFEVNKRGSWTHNATSVQLVFAGVHYWGQIGILKCWFFEREENRSAGLEKTLPSPSQISTHIWHQAGIEAKLHLPAPPLLSIVMRFLSPEPPFRLVTWSRSTRQRHFTTSSSGDENEVMQKGTQRTWSWSPLVFLFRVYFLTFFAHWVCIGPNGVLPSLTDLYRVFLFCFVFQPLSPRSRIYCQKTRQRNMSAIWLQ